MYVIAIFIYNALIAEYFMEFDMILGALNTLLLIYECLQMSIGSKAYLSSVWNLLDLFRILMTYMYVIIDYLYYHEIYQNPRVYEYIVACVMVLALFRTLSIFEIYSRTRSIIKIFFDIIKDARIFFLLFVWSTLGLTFFLISCNIIEKDRFIRSFTVVYNLNFGGFDLTIHLELGFIWFYLATFTNLLLMINLLVAIMNETFEKSHENMTTKDLKALTERIIEIESVLVWRKHSGAPNYMQSCTSEINEDIREDKLTRKLGVLSKEVFAQQRSKT